MKDEMYSTKDLFIASTLDALDLHPDEVSIDILDGKRVAYFTYKKNLKKIAKTIKSYFDSELLIEPQKLFYSLKMMKNRIYNN